MSRILLIGYNPPQLVKNAKIEAAHYRTWQFLQPLIEAGHCVCLCAGARNEPVASRTDIPAAWSEQLQYRPIPFGQRGWVQDLQKAHDEFNPDCVVAVNFSHALYASKLETTKPIWMDIYGDFLTIVQAANFRVQSDRGLETSLAFMREVLKVGDVFSGCGRPQQHLLVGELAMCGRLNRHTFGYEFTRVILPGSPPAPSEQPPASTGRQLLRTHSITADDFVVLWCGGYNTWTDVETLFRALESAMKEQPHIHYVSVGANTYEGADNVYERFLRLIEQSELKDNFHMLGWRPWSEVEQFYKESDVGINIDALHYETVYGTRTRLVEMIASGLPVITSLGAELSYLLQDRGAALTYEVGDWQTLGVQIGRLTQSPELHTEFARAALAYAQNELSFTATTAPLLAWVQNPVCAPDKHQPATSMHRLTRINHKARAVVRQGLWHLFGAEK